MTGVATAKTIDIHAHAVLAETMGAAGRFGPEMGETADGKPWFRVGDYRLDGVRYKGGPFMEVDLRLQRMDAAGVDFQVLSPNPLTYFHFIEAEAAIGFCRAHNEALARLIAPYPGRLAGAAALPMQDPLAAGDELARAMGELGLWGGYIGTDMPHALDDPIMDSFYERVVALNAPLFIHPAPAGLDGPAGDPRLRRFDLDLLLGFAAQETLAVATLILGGVLDRHPDLDICVSHGGGAVAFLAGRLSEATLKRPWSTGVLRTEGAFEERLKRLWFDTHVHDDRAFNLLLDVVGPDRLVFGTNFAGWDQPEEASSAVPAGLPLADNARRLLRRA